MADLNRMHEDHVARVEEDLHQHHHQHTHPSAAAGGAAATSTEHVTQWYCSKPKVLENKH